LTDDPNRDEAPAGAANRLAGESSAYLLQHSRNPVDWYPWGDEALARARELDRPLLVSIGYSSCHWCHVMERESFEDEATAALMNAHFVSVKVDREERPDVDQIYMDTVTRLTGHGGWPLTVFCLPDGSPFYAGTYYPDEPRHGMPSFKQLLASIADAWESRRSEVEDAARQIVGSLDLGIAPVPGAGPGPDDVVRAARLVMKNADWSRGGFGAGPKFPTPTNLELLLAATDFLDPDERQAVATHLSKTAEEMARRGLYDHLGGGFHRYCVDGDWTIPHFEKMLYDQGLLLRFYAEMHRRGLAEDDPAWPMRETVEFLRREMTSPEGGFYASQDADAGGVEGAYQVWTPEQVREVLGDRADAFAAAYGVTREGNFEHGTTHLIDVARRPRAEWAQERAALRAAREQRVAPDTDRKRVAAWNGYTISGLARAAQTLEEGPILTDAIRAMDFLLDEMVDDDGRLYRIFDKGRRAVPAFLDDHAALLDAALDLHRAGASDRYLVVALHLAQQIGDRFIDPETGTIYFTPADGERLVHRPRSDHDGATPAAAGLAAVGLCRLAQLSGLAPFARQLDGILAAEAALLDRAPQAFPTLVRAAALRARGLSVAVVIGDEADPRTAALAVRARRVLGPEDAVVVVATDAERPTGIAADWLAGRVAVDGQPTAYVCHGTRCSLPAVRPEDIAPLS
jgi:uncharacterized protein YyaL (SSP411 family)